MHTIVFKFKDCSLRTVLLLTLVTWGIKVWRRQESDSHHRCCGCCCCSCWCWWYDPSVVSVAISAPQLCRNATSVQRLPVSDIDCSCASEVTGYGGPQVKHWEMDWDSSGSVHFYKQQRIDHQGNTMDKTTNRFTVFFSGSTGFGDTA